MKSGVPLAPTLVGTQLIKGKIKKGLGMWIDLPSFIEKIDFTAVTNTSLYETQKESAPQCKR